MATRNGVKFEVAMLSRNKYDIKCPYPMNPKGVTLHNTFNDASAKNEIAYMQRNNNQTSFHRAVDNLGCLEGIPTNRNSWSEGDGLNGYGNRNTIAYEICYSKSGGEKYDEAETNTIKLVAQDLYDYNWTIEKVWKHQDWSGKNCPHRILARTRGWEGILKAIQSELDKLNGKVSKPSKPTVKPPKKEVETNTDYTQDSKYPKLKNYGKNVKRIQSQLRNLGYAIGVDSSFGPGTDRVVRAFQRKHGLSVDGQVGPATQSKLKQALELPNLSIDGYEGANTIEAEQDYHGTPVDGIISRPSLMIKKRQALLGVRQDGYAGEITIRAEQKRYETPVDGYISKPSEMIKERQRRLNRGKL